MARLSDLALKHRAFIAAYPFQKIDWRPGARLSKPLREARIALVTTAGLYLPEDRPFRHSIRHDDCSYREIPADTDVQRLLIGQSSDAFDHAGIESDRNLAFPLDRLRELVTDGIIGASAPRHFSIMGSIVATRALVEDTGPEIAAKLRDDEANAVLLVPVWPFCHQAAVLLQSIIEGSGIPTVSLSVLMEITRRVDPPRVLSVKRPLGYPLGEPRNPEWQREIMMAALGLLFESSLPAFAEYR